MSEETQSKSTNQGSRDSLYAALAKFQGVVPAVEKNRTANIPTKSGGSYSYAYADLGDIWSAIRKPLADNNLAVVQLLSGGEQGKTRLTTIIGHSSGQELRSTLELDTSGKTTQEQGSLFTYMKRYALGASLGISTEDDDDGQAGNKAPAQRQQATTASTPRASDKKPASEKQLGLIRKLAKDAKYGDDWVANVLMTINTSADASAVIEKIQEKLSNPEVDQR